MNVMVERAVLIDNWPEEHVKAVGQVSIAFTTIEYILRLYIKSLVGAKFDIGMGITLDNRQFRQIHNMASSLFKIRFQNEAQKTKEFEKLLDRCAKVAKRRNRVMHRLWTLDKKGQVVSLAHEVRGGIGLKANRQVVRVTELRTLYRDIMKLRDDLLTARERLIARSIKGAP